MQDCYNKLFYLKCIRRLKSYNANFFLRISFTVNHGEISRSLFTLAFNHLVNYSPWRNKTIKSSLKNRVKRKNKKQIGSGKTVVGAKTF